MEQAVTQDQWPRQVVCVGVGSRPLPSRLQCSWARVVACRGVECNSFTACCPLSQCDVDTFALALTAEPAAVASQVLSRCPPTTTAVRSGCTRMCLRHLAVCAKRRGSLMVHHAQSKEAFLRAVIKAKRYDLMGSLVACGVDPNCVVSAALCSRAVGCCLMHVHMWVCRWMTATGC